MKRVCIFVFFDIEGYADEHVTYYLNQLQPFLSRFVFVSNGKLSSESRELISRFAAPEDIIVRDNGDYDVGGYIAGMNHIGYEALADFDELILTNDSVFGPVFPLSEMFSAMDRRPELDFWGVTGHREVKEAQMKFNTERLFLAHIQSYFSVFRKTVLTSEHFRNYWETKPEIYNRELAIQRHGAFNTYYFEEKGFHWDTYIPISSERNTAPDSFLADAVDILRQRCPFVLRSVFTSDSEKYQNNAGEVAVRLRQYLEQHTEFDFNIIISNLLRTATLSDLVGSLNLYRVLPREAGYAVHSSTLKSMAIVHLYYLDLLDESIEYLRNIPEETDIFITSSGINPELIREKVSSLNNRIEILVTENRGRLAGAYLTKLRSVIMQYDVALIFHDKKTLHAEIRNNAESFFYKLAENTIPSKNFARGAINLFESDPRLGILMPSVPNHGTFYFTLGNEWGESGQDQPLTAELLGHLGVSPSYADCDRPMAPFGDIYWFRVDALLPLFQYPWDISDFPEEPCPSDGTILHALERVPCLLAQSRGFYSAYLFSDSYFGIEHAMYSDYLRKWNELFLKAGIREPRHCEALADMYGKLRLDSCSIKQSKTKRNLPQHTARCMALPLSTKIRLSLKFLLPKSMYKYAVILKRKIFGPQDKPFVYEGDEWEQYISSIKDVWSGSTDAMEIQNSCLTEAELSAVSRYNLITCDAENRVCKVSVIIPCYNHAEYIEERIRSILAQTCPVHEIIFLDDASSDTSVEIAKRVLKDSPCEVKIIVNEKNSGSTFSQWRKGLEQASGDYIWIAESDDYCRPDFLKTALLPFADENVVISFTESVIVEDAGETERKGADIHNYEYSPRYYYSYINSGVDEISKYLSVNNYILNASAVVWKKQPALLDIFADAEKFSLAGDWYSYLRVLQTGDIAYSYKPLNCYRFHKGTVRDSISKRTEYIEICAIHDWIHREEKLDLRNRKRQRIRREMMERIPNGVRKKILWVITPPLKGSGGHRTILNHINSLIESGYDCDLYMLYTNGLTPEMAEKFIEDNSVFCAANVITQPEQLSKNYDLSFATSWDTVATVSKINSDTKAYFVQDYEPWFFGSNSLNAKKAEKTYHLGLKTVTIGKWLAHKIESVNSIPAEHYDFGVDTSVYYDMNQKRERAICAVFQPEKRRRYADMVCRVLERIHQAEPDIKLYAYGSDKSDPRLKTACVTELGIISVNRLNQLYNECAAGLCISLSNPSRIPFEMMASGLCVVDVDVENNRYDYPNHVITLCELDDEKIAEALISFVDSEEKRTETARNSSEFMKGRTLEMENSQFLEIVKKMIDTET